MLRGLLPALIILSLACMARPASAQVLTDDFNDGTLSAANWTQASSNPAKVSLTETGGRLRLSTFSNPAEPSASLNLSRISSTWGLGMLNGFKLRLRFKLQRPNMTDPCVGTSTISDQSGLVIHFTSVDTAMPANTAPDGIAVTIGYFAYDGCVYRAVSVLRIVGGVRTTLYEYAAIASDFWQELPTYRPNLGFSLPEDENLAYLEHIPAAGKLRLSFSDTMYPYLDIPLTVAAPVRPVRVSLGGYTVGAIGALDGTASWMDDFTVLNGDVCYRPTGLTATQGSSTSAVNLAWDATPGATKYSVYRSNSGTTAVLLGTVTAPTTTYADTTATAGLTTRYLVRAESAGGVSESSDYAYGWRNVAAPAGVAASDGTATANVSVTWTAVTGASSYKVFRAVGDAAAVQIGTSVAASFLDTTVTPGVVATYSVKAVTPAGDSVASGTDTGWRRTTPPTSLTASQGTNAAGVTLTWPAAAGATAYTIYRVAGTGTLTALDEVAVATPNVTYTDIWADRGKLYTYAITTEGAAPDCESAKSITKTGWRPTEAPTAVTAADGDSTAAVSVNWAATLGAASYRVYRSTGGGALALVGSPTGTSYSDTTAVPGTLYSYVVKGFGGAGTGEGAASTADTGWRMLTPPASVTATDGTSTANVGVSWPASTGAASYKVLRSVGGAPAVEIKTVTAPAVSCTDIDAVPGTNYTYSVKAVGRPGTGESVASAGNVGWRMLTAPTGVTATDGTSTSSVTVSWTAASGAVSYQVFRSGTVAAIATTAETSFEDTLVTPGALFTYTVKAVGLVGTSLASTGNTGWRAPVAPAGLTASDGTSLANVALSWTAVPGAASYKILRAAGVGAAVQVGTSVATTYNDLTAVPGTLYTYTVKAAGAAGTGEGAASASNTGWRMLTAPVKATATDGTSTTAVNVTWPASVGASGYRVLRAVGAGAAAEVGTTGAGVLTYADSTGTPGTIYTYTVKAIGAVGTGDSGSSVADTGYVALSAPTGVIASDGTSAAQVSVSWTAVTGATGYKVLRGAVQVGTTSGNGSTNIGDVAGVAGTTYSYSVKAVGPAGVADSAASTPNTGWRNLTAPGGLTATDSNTSKVIVTWTAVTGATGYFVYRGPSPDALVKINGGTAVTTPVFNDLTAAAGTTYVYAVTARSASGESALSATDTGTRPTSFSPSGLGSLGGGDGGDGGALRGPGGDADPADPTLQAPMGVERYLQVIAVTPDAAVRCDGETAEPGTRAQVDASVSGSEAASDPERDSEKFVDLDGNGVPDLCQLREGDLDLDGTVGEGDLAVLLTMVGQDPGFGIGDLDGDGVIDPSDVRWLLERLGGRPARN